MNIKVDFLFQWAPGWSNFESVISALEHNGNIVCRLVLLPFHHSGQTDHHNQQARDFLNARGISWIWHEDYDYLASRPDVIFIQNPYDFTRPERFSCRTLAENHIKYAYIPYGLDVGEGDRNLTFQYNMDCHNLASWIFVRSEQHKNLYNRYCHAGNKHVHVTGHPKFDSLTHWKKKCVNARKTLLWTPHFVENEIKGWSTFNLYCDTMIYIAINYPIDLIVRPHPLFIGRLKVFGGAAVEKLNQLIEYSKVSSNITLDFDPSYNKSFAKADALMADAGSFLIEFLPTQKPILYLTHETCLGLNKSAKFITKTYYLAQKEKDIDDFVNMLIHEQDPKKDKRLKALHENLFIPKVSAGNEISHILLKYFARKMAKETRITGDSHTQLNDQKVLNFFESRATSSKNDNHLTMTMYQSAELAAQRDAHEKALILPKLMLTSHANVLDIGCGNGRWYESIKDKDLCYTGVDFSPSLISIAKEKYSDNEHCNFYVKKADSLSPELLNDNQKFFSHIIISGVTLYLNDDEVIRMFKNMATITQSGTLIFLREPLANSTRLTLNEHWSEDLNSHYSAIYRTQHELFTCIKHCAPVIELNLIESGEMYPDVLNNRKETQQHYYIFKIK